MKNIIMMTMVMLISISAFAGGPKIARGGVVRGGSPARVVVVNPSYGYRSFGYGYSPFYRPYYGFNSFYYPFGYEPQQPSKLDLDIQQIQNDYHHQIADVRHDNRLSKSERREQIRNLRHERENSIIETKKDFYNSDNNGTE